MANGYITLHGSAFEKIERQLLADEVTEALSRFPLELEHFLD